jgi:hypothetical protein
MIWESPLAVWPPEFVLGRCRSDVVCPEVITPYSTSEYFATGARPDQVIVHDRSGRREVAIEDIPTDTLFASTEVTEGEFDEAVGLSGNFSFDEAFRDAMAKLPKRNPSPDEMVTIVIVQIGAWLGGIAGFHHLFVRLRQPRREAAT